MNLALVFDGCYRLEFLYLRSWALRSILKSSHRCTRGPTQFGDLIRQHPASEVWCRHPVSERLTAGLLSVCYYAFG